MLVPSENIYYCKKCNVWIWKVVEYIAEKEITFLSTCVPNKSGLKQTNY